MAWLGSYPTSASAMAAAVGYGSWDVGWLFNEASGSAVPAFGTPTLASVDAALTYGADGPLGGADKSFTFVTSDFRSLDGGDVYDVTGTQDIAVFMVIKFNAGTSGDVVGKALGASAGWQMQRASSTQVYVVGYDAIGGFAEIVFSGVANSTWYVLGLVWDRGANALRIGAITETGSASVSTSESIAGVATLANSSGFGFGSIAAGSNAASFDLAAAYVAQGASAATGMSANLATALTNFRNKLRDGSAGGNLLLLGCG